jgi:O-antigen/teichoic acid export membrane protein
VTPAVRVPGRAPGALARRVALNIGLLLAGNAAEAAVATASSMVLARHLGVVDYGKYSVVFLYVALFQGVAQFGVDDILTRELSRGRRRADVLVGSAVWVRLALACLAVALCVATVFAGERNRQVAWATVLGATPLLLSVFYVPLWSVLQARLEHPVQEAIVVASRFAELVLLVGAALLGAGFLVLVGTTVVGHAVPLLLTWWLVGGRLRVRWRPDLAVAKDLLLQAAPVGAASIVVLVYARVDGILLSWLRGYEAVGLYNAAYKFVNLVVAVPGIVNFVLFPLMARIAEDRQTAQAVFQKSFDYLMLAALPLAVGTTLLAPRVVAVVYGPGFEAAAVPLRILIWAAALMYVTKTCRYLLVAGGQQAAFLLLMVAGASANILLNLWWIPRAGIVGAAWATLATEAMTVAVSYLVVRRRLALSLHLGFVARVSLATAGMALGVVLAASLGFWVSLAAGVVAYAVATGALGLWPPESRALLGLRRLEEGAQGG